MEEVCQPAKMKYLEGITKRPWYLDKKLTGVNTCSSGSVDTHGLGCPESLGGAPNPSTRQLSHT